MSKLRPTMRPTKKPDPLPLDLFASIPSYGFTGSSKEPPTPMAMGTLASLMINEGLMSVDGFYWHFGDCVLSDVIAFEWVTEFFLMIVRTVAHPGHIEAMRAHCKADQIREPMKTIARNARIAYLAHNGLFAMPRNYTEVLHSGTWATIRVAGKLKRRTWIIKPDGSYDYYEAGYQTVLTREALADEGREGQHESKSSD